MSLKNYMYLWQDQEDNFNNILALMPMPLEEKIFLHISNKNSFCRGPLHNITCRICKL